VKSSNVQALRAIAALMVIGAHLVPMELKCLPGAKPFLSWVDPVGFTGVDLFFAISGFVIITSTWSSFGRPGIGMNFILRRAARIFPVYWIVIAPIAVLDVLLPSWVNSSQAIRPDIVASFALLPQPGLPLLTVSWSLVYEMYFYYIYAVAIGRTNAQLPWVIGGWMLVTGIIATVFHGTKMPYLAQLGNTITYEFGFGMLIGWLFVHGREFKASWLAVIVGLSAVVSNTVFYPVYGQLLHGPLRFLIVGLPMALILYGFVGLELKRKLVIGGLLVALGDASYSIYLWHVPVLDVITHLTQHRQILRSPLIHWAWLTASVAVVLVLSLALYRFIERPLVRAFGGVLRLKSPGTILPNVSGASMVSGSPR
jgi:exopolysaccharide production protein ExoZ